MKFEGIDEQPSVSVDEHLEYLHPTEQEKLRAKFTIQRMVMARLFGFSDIGDDPDPERTKKIEEGWIDTGLAAEFSDLLNKQPELILKFLHSGEYVNSPVDSGEVIDEILQKLDTKHEVHA